MPRNGSMLKQAIIFAKYDCNVQFSQGFSEGQKYEGKKHSLETDYKD